MVSFGDRATFRSHLFSGENMGLSAGDFQHLHLDAGIKVKVLVNQRFRDSQILGGFQAGFLGFKAHFGLAKLRVEGPPSPG